jgi:hypothetical protein
MEEEEKRMLNVLVKQKNVDLWLETRQFVIAVYWTFKTSDQVQDYLQQSFL